MALVLTRKSAQKVRIITPSGEIIWIWLTQIDRDRARIHFSAGRQVQIDREENLPVDLQSKD